MKNASRGIRREGGGRDNSVLALIRALDRAIAAELKVSRLLPSVCALLADSQHYNSARITLLSVPEQARANHRAMVTEYPSGEAFDVDARHCACLALERDGVHVIPYPSEACGACPIADRSRDRAALTIRLQKGPRIYGCLTVGLPPELADAPFEHELLSLVATDLAIAIATAEATEERNRLTAIVEATTDIVSTASLDRTLLYLNPAGRQFFGLFNDLSNHRIEDLHPNDAFQLIRDVAIPYAIEEGVWRGETEIVSSDGKVCPVSQIIMAHRDSAQNLVYISTILRDMSERKRAAEHLRHSNELMQFVMDAMPSHVFWKNTESVYLGCNKNFARVAGVESPAEIAGKTDYDLAWKKEQADWFVEFDRQVMEADEARYHVIEPQRHAGGKDAWIDANKAPLHDEAGNIIGVMGCYDDITERMAAEQRLRKSEARYRLLAENALDLIWLCSLPADGLRFRYVNPAVRQMLGCSVDDVEDKSFMDLLAEQSRTPVLEAINESLLTAKPSHFLAQLVHAAGHTIECEIVVRPVRDEDGVITCLQGRMTDITKRLKAERERALLEQQLRQSQKLEAVGQLAGGIAHDFNNLLTAILGNIDMSKESIHDELGPDHPLATAFEEIEEAAHRAASLTRQLLTFSRRDVITPKTLNLNVVLSQLEKLLRRLITENVSLSTSLAEGLMAIRADAGHVEQVVVNLVVNAVQAMPQGGRLVLETKNTRLDDGYIQLHPEACAGPHVMMSVSDTGHGIDAATLERIFEPFFTTKFEERGTGLGLATVHGIVMQIGGSIEVCSNPGMGTTFKVYFPAIEQVPEDIRAVDIDEKELKGNETVLLCEDDSAVRGLCTAILSSAGYHVIAAKDGAAMIEAVSTRDGPIDLLVTDVIMPDMDGRTLARRLETLTGGIRVLFISGYTSNMIAHHGVLDRTVNFLEKPFTRFSLLEAVRAVLDSEQD